MTSQGRWLRRWKPRSARGTTTTWCMCRWGRPDLIVDVESATPPLLGTPRWRENCASGCPPTPVPFLVVEAVSQPGVGARPEGSRTVAIEHAGQNFGSLPRSPGSPPTPL
jgi:hypothetical protein